MAGESRCARQRAVHQTYAATVAGCRVGLVRLAFVTETVPLAGLERRNLRPASSQSHLDIREAGAGGSGGIGGGSGAAGAVGVDVGTDADSPLAHSGQSHITTHL